MRFYISISCDDPREIINTEDMETLRHLQDVLDVLEERPAAVRPGGGFRLSDRTEIHITKLED